MIRPMTSYVSALSGIVANGHQAIHFVSSAPSKISYDGFFPVRLQSRFAGTTFSEYISRVRAEKAKALLANSGLRIHEVADRAGFQLDLAV